MLDPFGDARVRGAAFEWLAARVEEMGEVLPRALLAEGFELDRNRVPLLGPQGIFKPRVMELPLSITTSPNSPYDDRADEDGPLEYRYRGTDPGHRDNVGLRTALERRLPLVYFFGLVPGRYLATWPVFVVGDRPEALTFLVDVDDYRHLGLDDRGAADVRQPAELRQPAEPRPPAEVRQPAETEGRRRYVTAIARRRLHQHSFRERVLAAYRSECSFCRFRHEELLDAAHIIPDTEPGGEPLVTNGLALCKLHHAAFDRGFLGVRPDYVLEVRPDLLGEEDGPTLVHSIQSLQSTRIQIPRKRADWPAPRALERRYHEFLRRAKAS